MDSPAGAASGCVARRAAGRGHLRQKAHFERRKRSPDHKRLAGAIVAARHRPYLALWSRHGAARAQKKSQQSRLSFPETILPAVAGDALEIDELVIRFRFKRRYRYLWLVISRLTHQVVAWRVGDRSEKTLQKMWWQVPPAYRRKLVYTDFYEAYTSFFRAWQHRPCEKGSGKTSVIEGLNNKWRNRVSGLVRKTVCVQSLSDLDNRLWLVLAEHNLFCLKQLEKIVNTP